MTLRRRLAAAGIAAMPLAAEANSGVGLLVLATPYMFLGLIPAILIEAPFLARFLTVGAWRALKLSVSANLVSTVLGIVIALASDLLLLGFWGMSGSRATILIALVPMFLITVWLERIVVQGMQPAEQKSQARKAVWLANTLSYLLLAVYVAATAPALDQHGERVRLGEVINAMHMGKIELAEEFQRTGKFPSRWERPPSSKYARSITLRASGVIEAVVAIPETGMDGRRLLISPTVKDGQIVAWVCRSPDIAPRYLPSNCRD